MKEKLRKNESGKNTYLTHFRGANHPPIIKCFIVNVTITIDASERFQNIFGFGGAFTDSAGDQFVSLSETLQNYIVDSYFGKNGLEYNIGRVPIASCDFSTHEYSYDDVHDDFELKHFALPDEDLKLKVILINGKTSKKRLKLSDSIYQESN